MATIDAISPSTLQEWITDGEELALFDVREAGQFGEGHLFFAVPLPYSSLETDVLRLAPRKSVRVVLTDDGDGLAELAAGRLVSLGYEHVFTLAGGVQRWVDDGFTLFKGVNVPSKTFGELAEHAYRTPHITATELDAIVRGGSKIVILDGRTVEEHHKMTIPGSMSCPNGELAYRLRRIVPDDDTTIVVNCAGRTRSIIGAQTLRNIGISNPVLALENGTQGWYLSGLELEHGSTRRYPQDAPASLERERRAAVDLLARFKIPLLSTAQAQDWLADPARTTFVFDVRTPEEHAAGALQGARNAPGGHLIQATDQYVGVRRSRLILLDDDNVRAPVVATWMHQLGFEVAVLQQGSAAGLRLPVQDSYKAEKPLAVVAASELREFKDAGQTLLLLDVRPSAAYRKSHARGAIWATRQIIRSILEESDDRNKIVVLVADKPETAELIALDIRETGIGKLYRAEHGNATLEAAGFTLEATPNDPPDQARIDYLFFVHDRHEGNKEAAKQYLEWEMGLIAQCTANELATFRLPLKD